MEVIFRGEKHIAGVEALLEFVLVNHKTFGVIEIVCSDKSQGIEADRLYVDDSLIRRDIGSDDSQVTAFLVDRICILNYDSDLKRLKLSLSDRKAFSCYRPLGLKPYALNHVNQSGDILLYDRRIPAVFARLNQGEALEGADAELWANFTRNKSEQEVIKIVAAMLAEKLPESAEVMEGAVQASTMPSNTPFPSHSEVAAPLMSSRSCSDFSKMSLEDNSNDDLFAPPPLVRVQSYGSSTSSPRSVPASPAHRKGELMVPSPSHRMPRAPLPRSGTSSSLSSPTALKSTSGIAEAVVIVEEEKAHKGHKRVGSFGVLDSLKDALTRGLGMQGQGAPTPGERVDTASSSDSNLSTSRGIAVDAIGGSSSSKKMTTAMRSSTPPMSPRPPLDAADLFPPHSVHASRSNSFSSTNGGLSTPSRRHSFVTGQMIPSTPPPSAKLNVYAGLDCSSTDGAVHGGAGSLLEEGIRERTPSRAASPSLLRAFTNWGSGSGKVVPGEWDDENYF